MIDIRRNQQYVDLNQWENLIKIIFQINNPITSSYLFPMDP